MRLHGRFVRMCNAAHKISIYISAIGHIYSSAVSCQSYLALAFVIQIHFNRTPAVLLAAVVAEAREPL